MRRLAAARSQGITTCEVKTGYGLYPEAELRLLRLITQAARRSTGAVAPTFLCHVPPPQLDGPADRQRFVDELIAAIPRARALGATSVDVYCDVGAFSLAETTRILEAGQTCGLLLRCHAEQFTHTGAAERAAQLWRALGGALEEIDEAGIAALAQGKVVAHLLPGAVVTLRLRWPDARRLIRAGVRVALGSDCNPAARIPSRSRS